MQNFSAPYHLLAGGHDCSDVYMWHFYKYIYKDLELVEFTAKKLYIKN